MQLTGFIQQKFNTTALLLIIM